MVIHTHTHITNNVDTRDPIGSKNCKSYAFMDPKIASLCTAPGWAALDPTSLLHSTAVFDPEIFHFGTIRLVFCAIYFVKMILSVESGS